MKMISKLLVLFLLTIFSSIVQAKPAYFPSHLKQFKETGKCMGCDLSQANFSFAQHNNADLTDAILVRIDGRYASFYESIFTRTQLAEANLYALKASGSNFSYANLTGANLEYSNLSSCDFTGANLAGADLSRANLVRAVISNEQLASAKSISCAILPDGSVYAGNTDRC